MPDAARALLLLAHASVEKLSRRAHNVTSFSLSAVEIRDRAAAAFPNAQISRPDRERQAIIDSWPADMDDSAGAGFGLVAPARHGRRFRRLSDSEYPGEVQVAAPHAPALNSKSRDSPPARQSPGSILFRAFCDRDIRVNYNFSHWK